MADASEAGAGAAAAADAAASKAEEMAAGAETPAEGDEALPSREIDPDSLAVFGEPEGEAAGERDMSRMQFRDQALMVVPASVKMLSGCRDFETSADVTDCSALRESGEGLPGGACTNALLGLIEEIEGQRELGGAPWADVLMGLRERLKDNRFRQIPQFSSSRPVDLRETPFSPLNPQRSEGAPRKALLIGVNYTGTDDELNGCHNDVLAVRSYLLKHGFEESEIRILLDNNDCESPTANNIVEAMRWLSEDSTEESSLFFHFSGHGVQILDRNGDERDGQDEAIVPLDFREEGVINDDTVLRELIMPLNKDAHLTCLFDCCHSATICDLAYYAPPHSLTTKTRDTEENPRFNFKRFLHLGKELVESANESLSGGLKNLVDFVKGFGSVFPI